MTIGTVYSYEVYSLDYFAFLNDKHTKREWNFEIRILKKGENLFEVSFSKELIFCFNHLHDLIKLDLNSYSKPLTFQYKIRKDNLIEVVDKSQIIKYLKHLQSLQRKKHKLNDDFEGVEYFLKYKEALDKSLLREIELIHEFDGKKLNVGTVIIDNNDYLSLDEFKRIRVSKKDETKFLKQINWENISIINIIRISKSNKSDYIYDTLIGANTLSSSKVTDLRTVSKNFLDDNFEIDSFEDINLVRDKRQLSKNGILNFLCKERRTVSGLMRKITKLEIKKKQQPT